MRSLSGPGRMVWPLALPSRSQAVRSLFSRSDAIGGTCLSAELTLPGFVHDVCSAVHPFAVASPFFKSLPLSTHGLECVTPPVMLAHPLDNEPSGCLYGSVEKTAEELRDDGAAYR
jgi:phytoene dehydrogenase-like protein